MKLGRFTAFLGFLCSFPVTGQTTTSPASPSFDSSGDSLLTGTYYFRDINYVVADSSGDLKEAMAIYGTITFNGMGGYTVNGVLNDSSQPQPQTLSSTTGTYTISASGYGYISDPVSTSDNIYGLATRLSPFQPAVFVGSATETTNKFNDLFIAAPVPASPATNATLDGTYTIGYMNFPPASEFPYVFDSSLVMEAVFQMKPDGLGDIGTVNISGYEGASGPFTATEYEVGYSFSNAIASIMFPVATSLPVNGTENVYVSPDGNFIFGGSPTSWDMLIGVRTSPASGFGGLYYEAGIDEDVSQLTTAAKVANLDTYYGAFSGNTAMIIGDQRIHPGGGQTAIHRTYADAFTLSSDGTLQDSSANYATGAEGAIRIGYGSGAHLSLSVALQAPTFSGGTSVYLSPVGVVNSASFAPFTAGVAPGELITLYGSNLASGPPQAASAQPLPTTLGGVQVMINGTAAPLDYVSATQINALVPYTTQGPVVAIQINNNGVNSNTVTELINLTDPGVFLEPSGGILYGAVLHPDYTLVTPSSPAQIGEIVSIYATGLGTVSPGATYPFTVTNNPITVSVGGVSAIVSYCGTAPGWEGLYQINVEVPAGVPPGPAALAIAGPDSITMEAFISVASSN
jgi:uncharacterized protein (TIGR03437 family)